MSQIEIYGQWHTPLPGGTAAHLAVAAQGEQYAVLYNDAGQWDALAFAYDEESARRAARLIEHIIAMPEHARIGGDGVLSGAGTDHAGVEWVTPDELLDDENAAVRIAGHSMRRLRVVPSVDGDVLGLLDPETEPHDLAEFGSVAAADAFISVIDALIRNPAYSVVDVNDEPQP
ncbi:hypothetical protein MUG78_13375 [Gordonia alkaliphila]|uniref:hypothetical protein n=1 Tax=Gordonia alkaliphila TaxID=1053547 RepID=UPI001FF499D1|nr:hypothetical protein [Gordonia alkaliphila]MCK0440417.1 hypothetical protein [Gordonia alkaliphila]